jgi:hypothetical protein
LTYGDGLSKPLRKSPGIHAGGASPLELSRVPDKEHLRWGIHESRTFALPMVGGCHALPACTAASPRADRTRPRRSSVSTNCTRRSTPLRYLQLIAEAHGFPAVNDRDCLPVHVEEWLAEHPERTSDWTRSQAINSVMRPFNWAAKQRLIPANPFRGVEKTQGQPRRPMSDAEFCLVLKSTGRKQTFTVTQAKKKLYPSDLKRRQRPSSGARLPSSNTPGGVYPERAGSASRPPRSGRYSIEHTDGIPQSELRSL